MCSLGDDTFDAEDAEKYMEESSKSLITDKCNKCKDGKPFLLLRNKDPYCKTCFLSGAVHKFKSALGKHRLIRPNDKVLIYHKPGHPSAALLHFLRSGINLLTPKKIRFEPIILYIDDQLYLTQEDRKKLLNDIKAQVKSFDFKLYFASLLAYITKKSIDGALTDDSGQFQVLPEQVLDSVVDKKCNNSNKIDILLNFKRQLLVDVAKELGCKFIFTPEESVDVATQFLSSICLGRGLHAPLDAGFCDSRNPEIQILRPLRLFDAKELALYNFLNDVHPVIVKEHVQDPSIQSLIETFVNTLQINYQSTVNTVNKTAEKLTLSSDNVESEKVCSFCKGPIKYISKDELTSEESTAFSGVASTETPNLAAEKLYTGILDIFKSKEDICVTYCYSCKKLQKYLK